MTDQPATPFGIADTSAPAAPVDPRLAALYPGDVPSAPAATSKDAAPQSPQDRAELLYPNDVRKPEPEGAADKPAAAPSADGPTAYELTAPQGFDLAPEMVEQAAPVFRSLGLSNDQANRLLPLAGKLIDRHISSTEDEFSALKSDWAKATMADPQLGGAKWAGTRRDIDRAFTASGASADFKRFLDETGLGSHPEMIRIFSFFGRLASKSAAGPRLSSLYPND